ncbi:hypothetical protein CO661_07850 [Sinorhizobium fredii]|uniref:Uncharacterized protein n=1 Tax=Rhizobium fredii TaxID=380 RepID=A0A2A6M1N1_RHIFR|nr:hypothetical protein CO661_07850 [Sinorhizobium fredii]
MGVANSPAAGATTLLPDRHNGVRMPSLQRRAPYQARKGRCSTLNCCMSLSLNRGRFKDKDMK